MKNTKSIAILLFAILLQLCSSGMELLTLGVGVGPMSRFSTS